MSIEKITPVERIRPLRNDLLQRENKSKDSDKKKTFREEMEFKLQERNVSGETINKTPAVVEQEAERRIYEKMKRDSDERRRKAQQQKKEDKEGREDGR